MSEKASMDIYQAKLLEKGKVCSPSELLFRVPSYNCGQAGQDVLEAIRTSIGAQVSLSCAIAIRTDITNVYIRATSEPAAALLTKINAAIATRQR